MCHCHFDHVTYLSRDILIYVFHYIYFGNEKSERSTYKSSFLLQLQYLYKPYNRIKRLIISFFAFLYHWSCVQWRLSVNEIILVKVTDLATWLFKNQIPPRNKKFKKFKLENHNNAISQDKNLVIQRCRASANRWPYAPFFNKRVTVNNTFKNE